MMTPCGQEVTYSSWFLHFGHKLVFYLKHNQKSEVCRHFEGFIQHREHTNMRRILNVWTGRGSVIPQMLKSFKF